MDSTNQFNQDTKIHLDPSNFNPQIDEDEQNKAIAQNLKFLFCIKGNTVKCCCCSVKVGILILSILGIIVSFYNIFYYGFLPNISGVALAFLVIFHIAFLVAYILLLVSVSQYNFRLAYIANWIYQINTLLYLVYMIFTCIFIGSIFGIFSGPFIVYYIITFLILYTIQVYLAYLVHSFTKLLGMGDKNAIEGISVIIVQSNVVAYNPPIVYVQNLQQQPVNHVQYQQPGQPVNNVQYHQPGQPVNYVQNPQPGPITYQPTYQQ